MAYACCQLILVCIFVLNIGFLMIMSYFVTHKFVIFLVNVMSDKYDWQMKSFQLNKKKWIETIFLHLTGSTNSNACTKLIFTYVVMCSKQFS